LCIVERIEDHGICRQTDLLAIWIDVPQSLNPCREFLFISFRKCDVLFAQGGKGAGEVGVFDAVMFFCFVVGIGEGERRRDGRVGDGVLTGDEDAVGQGDGDVVREVCVDGGKDGGVGWDGTDAGEEIDGGFERAGEEASAVRLLEITDACDLDFVSKLGILPRRKMEEMRTHPVKNKFPILAPEKSKLLDGLLLFTTSNATRLRIDRMSSFFAVEIFIHRSCSASTISSHSCRATVLSFGKRWLKKALMAAFSLWSLSGSSGMRRTRRPEMCQ
jgi:hypothetical protein